MTVPPPHPATLSRYKITADDYMALWAKQDGACNLCLQPFVLAKERPAGAWRAKVSVDHCHVTGRVRGLLCPRCNHYVGSIDALRRLGQLDKALRIIGHEAI